jgi:threonine dehydrogenase-like Zn-dependent dehydrogenase
MKAVWLENKVLRFRRDVPKPLPSEDEALIAVRLAGICGTDLQLINGYYPFSGIPGHEFVGEIIEAPQQPQRVGERVVGEINITCGTCNSCRQGHPTHCETRSVLGIIDHPGVFAEYVCLPLKNLIPVPDSVSDEAAVFVEPLAAALQIQQQITINSTDRILLVGAGRLGQLIAQTLILTKGNLQVVARYKNQRKLLKKHKINWLDESSVPRGLFDIVIEATGSGSGFSVA